MRIRTIELAAAAVAILIVVVVWSSTSHLDDRAHDEVIRAQNRAGYHWEGLVSRGIPPDSATQLALASMRSDLANKRLRATSPDMSALSVDSMWQAIYLNPFRAPGSQTPRTNAEYDAIRTSQEDLRLVREAGVKQVRERLASEATRTWIEAGVGVLLLAAMVGWRRRQ